MIFVINFNFFTINLIFIHFKFIQPNIASIVALLVAFVLAIMFVLSTYDIQQSAVQGLIGRITNLKQNCDEGCLGVIQNLLFLLLGTFVAFPNLVSCVSAYNAFFEVVQVGDHLSLGLIYTCSILVFFLFVNLFSRILETCWDDMKRKFFTGFLNPSEWVRRPTGEGCFRAFWEICHNRKMLAVLKTYHLESLKLLEMASDEGIEMLGDVILDRSLMIRSSVSMTPFVSDENVGDREEIKWSE